MSCVLLGCRDAPTSRLKFKREPVVKDPSAKLKGRAERRSFLKNVAAGGATVGAGLLASSLTAFGGQSGSPSKGDVAILRLLAAIEIIESDLWLQYAELGGTQDSELPGLPTGGSAAYTAALANLDADMAQYIHDNTEDEFSHQAFINAYLVSKGADPVNFDQFRTLPSSKATGANQIGRLTNLMQLTVDTSWWTRYRSRDNNPDLDPGFKFPQAVPSLSSGQFPAIPRSDADLTPSGHIQAIANTAAFHFGFIEVGGTSLYPTLAQKVTSLEVLRILLSIGPTETMHFQTWHDKAGNAVSDPLAPLTDSTDTNLVFPNLNVPPFGGEDFQTNLIMPEPCPFLSRKFPVVSIIRPTGIRAGGAVATIKAFRDDGLFIGQSAEFLQLVNDLAGDADTAERGSE
jgi:Ferritin-like domain